MKKVKEKNLYSVDELSWALRQKTTGEKILHWIVFAIFSFLSLTYVLPVIWLVIQSLHNRELYQFLLIMNGPLALPTDGLHFENYILAFTLLKDNNVTFAGMFFNTMWFIGIAESWCMFWPTLVGYIFAKYKFKGRELFYNIILFTMVISLSGTIGSFVKLVEALGIYDKGPLFVMATGIGGFDGGLLVFLGIFNSVAWDYAESVFIDGGGHFTAFWRVMLPQAMPAIGALMISRINLHWNDYWQFLMYMPSTPTVSSGVYKIGLTASRFGAPLYYAGLMFVTVPIIIIFLIFSERIMKNLRIGGLKG